MEKWSFKFKGEEVPIHTIISIIALFLSVMLFFKSFTYSTGTQEEIEDLEKRVSDLEDRTDYNEWLYSDLESHNSDLEDRIYDLEHP